MTLCLIVFMTGCSCTEESNSESSVVIAASCRGASAKEFQCKVSHLYCEGIAKNDKGGPKIYGRSAMTCMIFVDIDAWPPDAEGKQVWVFGEYYQYEVPPIEPWQQGTPDSTTRRRVRPVSWDVINK